VKAFVEQYSGNVFSQNGEDLILLEILTRIKIKRGKCVEFGAHNGSYCSNTANLIINHGWKGKMIEGDDILFGELLNNALLPDDLDCVNQFVTPENVNHLVGECDVLSVDIDGNDLNVWSAYKGKPAVVIIEINSSFPPHVFHWSMEQGSSYKSMVQMARTEKGYFLAAHTGNLVFIDEKYKNKFPEITADPINEADEYFNDSWLI
jgi:hypothetical protein